VKQARLRGALHNTLHRPCWRWKVYFTSETGKMAVVRAGKEMKFLLSTTWEECHATRRSPNGGLYVRTREAVYFFVNRGGS